MYYLVIYHLVIVTVVSVGVDGLELLYPEGIGDREVQESLNGIKTYLRFGHLPFVHLASIRLFPAPPLAGLCERV